MQKSDNGLPRRIRVDLYTRAELAIRHAQSEVEKAGAHPRLTDALTLLSGAGEACADGLEALGVTQTAPGRTGFCTECGQAIASFEGLQGCPACGTSGLPCIDS